MNQITRCLPLLGTFVEIHIEADISDKRLIHVSNQAFARVREIQSAMSFHNYDSELSKINRNAYKKRVRISFSMYEVINFSKTLSEVTGGIFDITIAPRLIREKLLPKNFLHYNHICGHQYIDLQNHEISFTKPVLLDLGGVAKGYAVDQAYQNILNNISTNRIKQFYINAGGDLRYYNWVNTPVYIANAEKKLQSYTMQAASLATSSGYYNNGISAIFDPISGQQNSNKYSISVFAEQCMHADALTKVATLDQSTFESVSQMLNAKVLIN